MKGRVGENVEVPETTGTTGEGADPAGEETAGGIAAVVARNVVEEEVAHGEMDPATRLEMMDLHVEDLERTVDPGEMTMGLDLVLETVPEIDPREMNHDNHPDRNANQVWP